MGKGGRFVCIFMPMVLTAASFVCLLLIGLGGLNMSSSVQSSLYFFKANTTNKSIGPTGFDIDGIPIGPQLTNISTTGNTTELADFYYVYLSNYCSGTANGTMTYCSPRTNFFFFNPETAWGLNETLAKQLFSHELQDALNVYKTVAHWMQIAFYVAIVASAVTFVVGFSAIFSRWGSFVTSGFAGIATLFTIAWAATVTAMYVVLVGAFDTALKEYDIDASLGKDGLALTWIACAFSLVAGFWWTLSICCCSGRSSHPHVRRPETFYQPVPSPHMHTVQQQQYFYPQKSADAAGPYEPNRSQL